MDDDYGQRLSLAVAERIAALRRQQGWSLDRLAAEASLQSDVGGLIERGERGMTIVSAAHLARALRVHLSELLEDGEADVDSEAGSGSGQAE